MSSNAEFPKATSSAPQKADEGLHVTPNKQAVHGTNSEEIVIQAAHTDAVKEEPLHVQNKNQNGTGGDDQISNVQTSPHLLRDHTATAYTASVKKMVSLFEKSTGTSNGSVTSGTSWKERREQFTQETGKPLMPVTPRPSQQTQSGSPFTSQVTSATQQTIPTPPKSVQRNVRKPPSLTPTATDLEQRQKYQAANDEAYLKQVAEQQKQPQKSSEPQEPRVEMHEEPPPQDAGARIVREDRQEKWAKLKQELAKEDAEQAATPEGQSFNRRILLHQKLGLAEAPTQSLGIILGKWDNHEEVSDADVDFIVQQFTSGEGDAAVLADIKEKYPEIYNKIDKALSPEVRQKMQKAMNALDFDKQEDYLKSGTGHNTIRAKIEKRSEEMRALNEELAKAKDDLAKLIARRQPLTDQAEQLRLENKIKNIEQKKIYCQHKLSDIIICIKNNEPEKYQNLLKNTELMAKINGVYDGADIFEVPVFGKSRIDVPKKKGLLSLESIKVTWNLFTDLLRTKTSARHKIEKRLDNINNLSKKQQYIIQNISGFNILDDELGLPDGSKVKPRSEIVKLQKQKGNELTALYNLIDQIKEDPIKMEKLFYNNNLRSQIIAARERVLGTEACKKQLNEKLAVLKQQLADPPNEENCQEYLNNLCDLYVEMRSDPSLWGTRRDPGFKVIEAEIASIIDIVKQNEFSIDISKVPQFVTASPAEQQHADHMKTILEQDSVFKVRSKALQKPKVIHTDDIPGLEIQGLSEWDYFLIASSIQSDIRTLAGQKSEAFLKEKREKAEKVFEGSYSTVQHDIAALPEILADPARIEEEFAKLPDSSMKREAVSIEDKARVLSQMLRQKTYDSLENYAIQLSFAEDISQARSHGAVQQKLLDRMVTPFAPPLTREGGQSGIELQINEEGIDKIKDVKGSYQKYCTTVDLNEGELNMARLNMKLEDLNVKAKDNTEQSELLRDLQQIHFDKAKAKIPFDTEAHGHVTPGIVNLKGWLLIVDDESLGKVLGHLSEEDRRTLSKDYTFLKTLSKTNPTAYQALLANMQADGVNVVRIRARVSPMTTLLTADENNLGVVLGSLTQQDRKELAKNTPFLRKLFEENSVAYEAILSNMLGDGLDTDEIRENVEVYRENPTGPEKIKIEIQKAVNLLRKIEKQDPKDRKKLTLVEKELLSNLAKGGAFDPLSKFRAKLNADRLESLVTWLQEQFQDDLMSGIVDNLLGIETRGSKPATSSVNYNTLIAEIERREPLTFKDEELIALSKRGAVIHLKAIEGRNPTLLKAIKDNLTMLEDSGKLPLGTVAATEAALEENLINPSDNPFRKGPSTSQR